MIDFWMGAVWTLLSMTVGALIGLLIAAAVRMDDGPEDDYPEPEPQPAPQLADELNAWLTENTITQPFEANLLP